MIDKKSIVIILNIKKSNLSKKTEQKVNMLKIFPLILVIFLLGVGVGNFYVSHLIPPKIAQEKNTPKAFLSEVYDKIKENYWENITDKELLDLFKLSIEKNTGQIQANKFKDKEELLKIAQNINQKDLVNVVSSVLASLQPTGRSGLFTQKQEVALKNTVENIDPSKDLYKDLGLTKGASEDEVSKVFQKQAEELKKQASAEAQEKLKQITYAKDVLSEKDTKQRYDQKGVEPTISTRIIGTNALYFQFKKFSPTSLEEFQKAFEDYKDTSLSSLIFDLRGNIGGAIDATAYFLGFFLGKNQYAFDFYKKGEYLPFKTPTDKLPSISKYKQIVVLVDNATQSSAEMMAASLKKYRVGVVLGVPTKGWGTVERVFPLDNQISSEEKYSMFLVHSITIRDDNQPIEGRGVDPDINTKDSNWQQKLFEYFRNQQLLDAVKSSI